MATALQDTRVQRHPIRGALYGLLLGLSAAIYLLIFSVTPFRWSTVIIIVAIGFVFGILWGSFAPARKPKDMPAMSTSLGTTYTRNDDLDPDAPASYEATFMDSAPTGEGSVASEDDGSFGAPVDEDEGDTTS